MKKCLNCKSDNRDTDKYCRNCGCIMYSNSHCVIINVLTVMSFIGLIFVIALFVASYFVYQKEVMIMKEEKKLEYYNETVEELYKKYDTNINGLSDEEASKRLKRDGENKLLEKKKKSNLVLFLGQFNDFMIILLIFASIFSAVISYVENESYID